MRMTTFEVKKFDDLTNEELWAILNLRCKVFVVEQECAYLDVDEYDKVAYHIMAYNDKKELCGCARVLPRNCIFEDVSIGRVISMERRTGLGSAIVNKAISVAIDKFDTEKIVIGAQTYARGLYEKCGFEAFGEPFIEDGIEHIHMVWTKGEQ